MQRHPGIEADEGFARHQRIVKSAGILRGIADDEWSVREDRVGTESRLATGLRRSESDGRFEPLTLFVDQTHQSDPRAAQLRGQLREGSSNPCSGAVSSTPHSRNTASRSSSFSGNAAFGMEYPCVGGQDQRCRQSLAQSTLLMGVRHRFAPRRQSSGITNATPLRRQDSLTGQPRPYNRPLNPIRNNIAHRFDELGVNDTRDQLFLSRSRNYPATLRCPRPRGN